MWQPFDGPLPIKLQANDLEHQTTRYRQLSEHGRNLSRFFDAIRQPLIASFVATAFSFSPLIGAESGDADKMASLTRAASALMVNAAQYEFTHQASWKRLLDGMDAEKVSAAVQAYPKLDVAMDVMTQSVIAIMAPHLRSEGSDPPNGKAPSRRVKKHTAKSPRKNSKKKAR